MRTILLAAITAGTAALAQPMDLYGFGPRAVAMGGTQAAAQHDFSAAYYNPALLDTGSVGVGFGYGVPSTWVHQTAPALGSQKLTDRLPVDYSGVSVGAAIPMRGLLKDKVTLGFSVYVPTRHVFRSHELDEATVSFLRYDSAPERFQLALGLSVRPFEWLSIGAGVQVLSNYSGEADYSTVLGNMTPGRVTSRRLDSEVVGAWGPVVGLAAGPFKHVRVLAFWRGEVKASYHQPINVDLGTFGTLVADTSGITEYAPHQAGLGVAIELLDGKLQLGADVDWEHWSATPSLLAEIHISLPKTITDLGFNKAVDSLNLEMGFSDVLVGRVGAEYQLLERARVRLGYAYRPTMVPAQTGRTNFCDSDAHLISVGGGWTFDDPLQMARSLSLDAAAQLTLLSPTEVKKVGNNANPNYRYGGTAWFFGAAVRYDF